LLNGFIRAINQVDDTMPLMFSPFFHKGDTDPKAVAAWWDSIFTKVNFRKGDIFCPQDSVGAGGATIDTFANFFKELKPVVDQYPNLSLWSNPENFKQSNWSSAPITRYVYQIQAVSDYVEGYISFAYSHYYAPTLGATAEKQKLHDSYLKYRKTGQIDFFNNVERPEVRNIMFSTSNNSVWINVEVANSKNTVSHVDIYRGDTRIGTVDVAPAGYSKETITVKYEDKGITAAGTYTYKAVAYDFLLNASPEKSVSYQHVTNP